MKKFISLLAFPILIGLAACTSLDQQSLRSGIQIPESAKTDLHYAKYDETKKTALLVLEPVFFTNSSKEVHWNKTIAGTSQEKSSGQQDTAEKSQSDSSVEEVGSVKVVNYASTESSEKITLQLASALGEIKNFKLLDYRSVLKSGKLKLPRSKKATETGPYMVRAALTEYVETIEEESSKVNLLTLYRDRNYKRTGVVGIDVSVVDPSTDEVVGAFPIRTTFSSQEKSNSVGLIADIAKSKKFAQSALDQALRQALYQTSLKLTELLLE